MSLYKLLPDSRFSKKRKKIPYLKMNLLILDKHHVSQYISSTYLHICMMENHTES